MKQPSAESSNPWQHRLNTSLRVQKREKQLTTVITLGAKCTSCAKSFSTTQTYIIYVYICKYDRVCVYIYINMIYEICIYIYTYVLSIKYRYGFVATLLPRGCVCVCVCACSRLKLETTAQFTHVGKSIWHVLRKQLHIFQ